MSLRWLRRWLPVLLWMGLIFTLSAQPDLPGVDEPLLDTLLKKAAHAAGYAVLALLVRRALGWERGRRLAWVLALLYAIGDEAHQSLVPGRHAQAMDVLIDALGAALALWFPSRAWVTRLGSRFRRTDPPDAPPPRAA